MEIVYVLTNEAMPGLVKIGSTRQEDANERIAQLYSTGVPVPFDLEYACKVTNAYEVELALHVAFGPNRINARREFFQIEPEQAIAILKLLHTEDATPEVARQPNSLDQESIDAAQQLKRRRPPMNFVEMGIPIGSTLHCVDDATTVCVVAPRKVLMNGEEVSLSYATRRILGLEHNVQPSTHWTFSGRSLHDIYNETYRNVEA